LKPGHDTCAQKKNSRGLNPKFGRNCNPEVEENGAKKTLAQKGWENPKGNLPEKTPQFPA